MLRVLIAPRDAMRAALADPRAGRLVLGLALAVAALGALTLPRQLPLLERALLGPGATPYGPLMYDGLRRLVLLDRLIPPLTPVLAGGMVYVLAGAWLQPTARGRAGLAAILVLGLAPLLVLRLGELLVVWFVPTTGLAAGDIVTLPRWFSTGPLSLVARGDAPPLLDALDARLNLISAWVVALWSIGLWTLDDGWEGWQIVLPCGALVVAGAVTWWLTAPVMGLVLGLP